tara:strand:- start:176 stop:1003 length:828 start_codon:yes stop_codon:yes gene_type:complete
MRIVVTGASGGIGQYLVEKLAEKHQIWGISRSEVNLKSLRCAVGDRFEYSVADVSDWNSITEAAKDVTKNWDYLDVLICCAGVVAPIGPSMEVDPEKWSDSVRINLDGTFYSIRAFFNLLKSSTGISKVFCFSGGGAASPRPNFTSYASSKSGVVRLVENLALEWEAENIDINAIAPGAVPTNMTELVINAGTELAGLEEYESAVSQMEDGEESKTKIYNLVSYLISSEANGISGKLISAKWDKLDEISQRKLDLKNSDIYTLRRIVPEDRGGDW